MVKLKRITNELMKWKFTRWWSPGNCHIALGFYVLTVPRRWVPSKEDKVRRCPVCQLEVFIEGDNLFCSDCAKVHKQIGNFLCGPVRWETDLKKVLRNSMTKTRYYKQGFMSHTLKKSSVKTKPSVQSIKVLAEAAKTVKKDSN